MKHMAHAKRARREQRDTHRRAAERESRQILIGLGLAAHPLARRIGRRLTDVETEISRLRSFLDSRGRHDNAGKPKPAYVTYLELQRSDRAELRHLLDELGVMGAGSSREVKHLVEIKRTPPPKDQRPAKVVVYVCAAAGHEHTTLAKAKACTNSRSCEPPQQADNGPKRQRGVRAALMGFLDRSQNQAAKPEPEDEQEVEPQLKFPGSGWPSDNWMN